MQVDSTLMNVGDGGTVSREISAPHKASTSMVGNPPQTLPAEFRRDVNLSQQKKTSPTKDCKTVKACLDTRNCNLSPELSPPQQTNNAPMSSSVLTSSEKRTDKRTEAPKGRADGPGVFPNSQWASSVKASREDSLNPYLSNVTSSKKSQQQTQSLQSAPAGFQCSAMFKPAQPVAFLPSSNFSSPLCKITLPPALGQIAAIREATTSQFQKEVQPQSSTVGGAALMRTYPFSLPVGRTAEQKTGGSSLKLKSNHSTSKNAKTHGEAKSLASAVASPAIALPLQHPSLASTVSTHFTLSPTAAICCSSALANITSQSRLLNQVEKGNGIEKTPMGSLNTAPPCAAEDHTACSTELRDVPLDLSAKSKRPKCVTDLPVSVTEPRNKEPNQRDFLNVNRTHSTAYSSAGQYPILPNTHRNGAHQKQLNRTQNHQVSESKSTWDKGSSQDSIKSIPGTYVGVASPILASALRGKDGKGTFADEFQSFAKQEFISIIDQGEHMASGGKKPSCLMKGNQHAHSIKHVKNTSTASAKNCPPKGPLTTALLSSANTHPKAGPGKTAGSYSNTVANPAWQQQSHLLHQPSSVQRKTPHGSPKTKGSTAVEGRTPSKTEDGMWDRIKSPLSNLASIVKQHAVEPPTLMGSETNSQAWLAASRKDDLLSPLTGGQEVPPKHKEVCEYYKSVEKPPIHEELPQAAKRQEKSTKPVEPNTTAYTSQRECTIQTTKQGSSKPADKSCLFGSSPSTNGNRAESRLAQVLEGETPKKDGSSSDSPSVGKPEGVVASILTGQYAGWGDKLEKKANGTKEESPTKAKAAAVKHKKSSPKKLAKEKSAPDKLTAKKKEDSESTPVKASLTKKQKKRVSELEQGLKGGKASQQKKEAFSNNKMLPSKAEEGTISKADSGSSPWSVEASETPSKEADVAEPTFPRLRRGRRRADDARLDLWGFATPSPPPPPMLPPADSPSSLPKTPVQPARRPRGRPRSNPVKEPMFQGKGKTASVEGGAPPQKKRQRCTSKKYETGEYITERDKLEDGEQPEDSLREDSGVQDSDPQADPSPVASSPELPAPLRKTSFTRSGSFRYQENEDSLECRDKPSGKRKFKSKHLCDSDEQKNKTKRISLGKRGPSLPPDDDGGRKSPCTPPPTPNSLPSPPPKKKSSSGKSSGSDSPPKKPVPPEVRRLIVNKNAGETLLQRAARLGYQDVVLYCLEKDVGEVNRRDNAGYTALHEASSRGWTQIVQILLKHGADVNCSAQDGTRPLHDAVASDNLPIVWLLLNHGADPTLATYSGHTPVKLAHSSSMKTFLTEYFTDLEGRSEQNSSLPWEFYSSSLFETDQEPCWDFLLSEQNQDLEENGAEKTEPDSDKDCLLFEFSSEPLLPCYHVQVSLTQGFCNWFLLADVLKRLKMSARIFRARYPYFEVVSLPQAELWKQVSISQVSSALAPPQKSKNKEDDEDEDEEGLVELVRCVQELQRLLGSSIHVLQDEDDEEEEEANRGQLCSR
ncbi:hypothetical protein OJAV_G00103120 [Oryzias javanicus]|uniref:BCL-6 corepressor PCGF1 binding domain-containing protein n=1 Tax=Oryzias javanicus TaxID=123683 RepID=A0A3S2MUZ2_ORYJA|nr:hypothetical protein OJAV_G00103120 [Oryzias javanicus]